MQSEAETGEMSHHIRCSINLKAERSSDSTQPQTIKESCTDAVTASLNLGLSIDTVTLPLTPLLVS